MSGKGKYKQTLNLPRSSFPKHVSLAEREQDLLQRWQEQDLYGQICQERADKPSFVLHDGPPYANGQLHYGHILNKVLKDLIVKYKTMAGFRSPYVPGWDTHGLPIELAVDRELGKRKREMSKADIRLECRRYAMKFVDIQREEFKRLGVFGAWKQPYLTLDPGYEAAIVHALAAFARKGYLYRGNKPVYWCSRDRTALAEAEIEYADHTSPSIYVRFPVDGKFDAGGLNSQLAGKRLALPIWTTTPWTLPANLAIVLHPAFEYVAVPSPRDSDEYLLVAKQLASTFLAAIGGPDSEEGWLAIEQAKLKQLEGIRYQHPFVPEPRKQQDFRVWFANYVTLEQGTGLVHTAPGHGVEDYQTGVSHELDVFSPVDAAGRYTDDVAQWKGEKTIDANPKIIAHLNDTGHLLSPTDLSVRHSYPHCWRCKQPVIYRATPQWFIRIDHDELRQRALSAIDATKWVPQWGSARIRGMIENRPDWCLSRQRVWGVPIVAFYCKGCGEVHADADTMDAVGRVFAEKGADAWYTESVDALAPGLACGNCGGSDFVREQDIVDVWFESGCSWYAVTEPNAELRDVEVYLEGSDQHRGWFHSSLLVGMAVGGKAPYKTVITHGFVLDDKGRAYSKSDIEARKRRGEKVKYVPPQDIVKAHGVELLRLWVASTEFRNDIPYSTTILDDLRKWYRKFRNTLWFLLGAIGDYDPNQTLPPSSLREVDRYALARLDDLVARVRDSYEVFEFHTVHRAIVDYVATEASAFYLDVTKDRTYLEADDSQSRLAVRSALYEIARTLALLTAPILAFTAEEVWDHLPKRDGDPASVHLALMPQGKHMDESDPLYLRWRTVLSYREMVTKQLESFRAEGHSSLEASIRIVPTTEDRAILVPLADELADLFIVSEVVLDSADSGGQASIEVSKHSGHRCERCWKWFSQLSTNHDDLCDRCSDVVGVTSL